MVKVHVHLVKLIEHPTEKNKPLCQVGTTQRIKGRRCTPVMHVSNRRPGFFNFPLTYPDC
jgi:hypothetical protein